MERGNFGSKFGILVAMTGSAVGLGNLWRFPFLVGTNGGAAFILIYLLFVIFLCLPIMYSEFLIGRRVQANAFGALNKLAPKGRWGVIGIVGVIGATTILSFYSVVGGWTVDYMCKAITFSFNTTDANELNNLFTESVSSTVEPVVYMLIFLLLTGVIVMAGVEKGIEKYAKIMMPVLFIMVVLIAIRSVTLPNSAEGLKFLFYPDFSQVTSKTILAALGQSFFSLSLGMCCILTYGSYVKKSENIISLSASTALADTLFAIIAGMAIMPAVFSFGISPSEGAGLVFVTLPRVFAQMSFGGVIAILFFVSLFLAAITSSISVLEIIVAFFVEELKFKRTKAVIVSLSGITVLSLLCCLSQGVLSDIKLFGLNFFDLFDKLSSDYLMTIGGLLIVIFVGWRMKRSDVMDELTSGNTLKIKKWFLNVTYFTIRFVAPVVILIVMLGSIFG